VAEADLVNLGFSAAEYYKGGVITKDQIAQVEKIWSFMGDSIGGYGNSNGMRRPISDYTLLSEAINNPLAYIFVDRNSTAVASTPWKLYKPVSGKVSKSMSLKGIRKLTKNQQNKVKARRKMLSDDEDIVEVTEHPWIDLLCTVNEDINGHQLFKLTDQDLEIMGRAYWYIDEGDGGQKRITPLAPQRMIPLRDMSGYVVCYQYFNLIEGYIVEGPTNPSDGPDLTKVTIIPKEQVIDFRFITSSDRFGGGLSPLRSAIRSVLQSSQYTDLLNSTLTNRSRADVVIIPKIDVLDENERARIEQLYKQRLSGGNNGKPLILDKSVDIKPLFWQPTDLAGLKINDEVIKLVANAFAYPPALIDKDSNYANMEASLELYRRQCILPRVNLFDQVLNENKDKLGLDDDGVFLQFDNPIPEDEEFELEQQKAEDARWDAAAKVGAITKNDVRERLGLEPVEGGDDFTSTTTVRLATPDDQSAPDDQPTEAAPKPTDDGDSADDQDAEGKRWDRLRAVNLDVAAGTMSRAVAINLAEQLGFAEAKALVGHNPPLSIQTPQTKFALGRRPPQKGHCVACEGGLRPNAEGGTRKAALQPTPTQAAVKKIKTAVAGWFSDLKKDALKTIKKSVEISLITKAAEGVTLKADTGKVPTAFTDIDDWIDNLKGTEDDLAYRVKPLIEIQAQKSAEATEQRLTRVGASPDSFAVVPRGISDAVDKRAYKFAHSTMVTTRKSLTDVVSGVRDLVEDGTLEGDSIDTLTQKVSDFFENAEDYQAERIARTEVAAAVTSGQVTAAKASKIVKGFKYLVSSDACPVCQEYSDEEVDIDDYDDSGEVDASGAVPIHPSCGCALLEVLDPDAASGGDTDVEDDSSQENEDE